VIKLISVILLIATCVAFVGSVSIAVRDPGSDLDMEELFLFAWNEIVAMPCAPAIAFVILWMIQITISAQILFSFFFYSWRNSIYDGDTPGFKMLFSSLETKSSF
jgi:hypothetical protein